jgi:DHA1 family bicyclomycin/chloramphenicol resistance-like MFS transporter
MRSVSSPVRMAERQRSNSALAQRANVPWGDVLLLGGLTAFGSVSMDMYLPAMPSLVRALKTTPAAAQQTVSIFLTGLAVGQLIYGPVSDRVGRRGPILFGVGVYLAASLGCALASSVGMLIVFRLLQALGACAGMVIARAVVRDRYEDHEVLHVFSLLTLVMGSAPILAPLIGGWVLSVGSWRWIFAIQSLFALVITACAFFFLTESRSEATRVRAMSERPLASYLVLIRAPRLAGLLLNGAFSGAALFAFITAAPEIVITLYHVPAAYFGWIFGVNVTGMLAAGQINARLARRVPGEVLLHASNAVALGCASLMVICTFTGFGGLFGVLIPLWFVMASLGFSQPNAAAAAMSLDRERAGATAALMGATGFGIGSLAGVATSLLDDGTAKPLVVVIWISLFAAVGIGQLMLRRPRARSPQAIG